MFFEGEAPRHVQSWKKLLQSWKSWKMSRVLWTTSSSFGQLSEVSKVGQSCLNLSRGAQSCPKLVLWTFFNFFSFGQLWSNFFQLCTCLGASPSKNIKWIHIKSELFLPYARTGKWKRKGKWHRKTNWYSCPSSAYKSFIYNIGILKLRFNS